MSKPRFWFSVAAALAVGFVVAQFVDITPSLAKDPPEDLARGAARA